MRERGFTTHYLLRSVTTGMDYEDTGWMLQAPGDPGLLRAVYEEDRLNLKGPEYGLYTFASWLPVRRMLQGSSAPVTYRSEGLSSHLGLKNLFITFSGYWPERGATMKTCSFKETEAYSVCARLDGPADGVLVVASAGNTARSFARVCSDNGIPLLLCVPEDNLDVLWFDSQPGPCVKLAITASGSDYYDAIHLSQLACEVDGFFAEGGAKNVARRDGMGTTVLSAATTIGRTPDYYFQAVGSGTGAIAAWEANLRLIGDGRFGHHKMKLMLSQNTPFHPMADAWEARSRDLFPMDDTEARKKVDQIAAKVLSNRRPPYAVRGGLFDALSDAGGEIFRVNNEEAAEAGQLFLEREGIDIHPAAAVATASLVRWVKENRHDPSAVINLNITGGGEALFKRTHRLSYLQPDAVLPVDPSGDSVRDIIGSLFK